MMKMADFCMCFFVSSVLRKRKNVRTSCFIWQRRILWQAYVTVEAEKKKITAFLKERTAGLLCLLDCDKFKSINDTYGHSVGDKVIIAIAEKLQKSCRDKDVIFRLGGDEFAMFMTGMVEQKAAERFFERLFQNIRQIDLAEMQGKKIEMSLGACFYDGDENVSFDELYRNADSAMYQSKKKQGYSYTIYDGQ